MDDDTLIILRAFRKVMHENYLLIAEAMGKKQWQAEQEMEGAVRASEIRFIELIKKYGKEKNTREEAKPQP